MKFTKMHGLGNDHIIIDLFSEKAPDLQKLALRMCDRHFGVGADGLIVVGPSRHYDFSMRVINADGSEAEMCGNGIRCLARYVVENGLTEKTEFTTETVKGLHTQKVHLVDGKFVDVRTSMGQAVLQRSLIPMAGEDSEQVVGEKIDVDGAEFRITAVNVGNPHCVVFVDDIDRVDIGTLGPKFEHHPLFPKRINTEFIQVLDKNNIRMRVWERSCGETLACGTGATASVVASILNGYTFDTVTVHLAYGDLIIEWNEQKELYMTGAAHTVFTGDFKI